MDLARAFALVVAGLFTTTSATFAAGCAPADASLAGHYYLHGVMEVGSELLLTADGRFRYMLAYGALDEAAEGCWSRKGDIVTLTPTRFEVSMDDPAKFQRLRLRVLPGGALERKFGDTTGRYSQS